MGMGEEDEIDRARIKMEGAAVFFTRFAPALEHAAIDQKAHIVRFHQIAGASHFARRAKKGQFHFVNSVCARQRNKACASKDMSTSLVT